MRFPSSVETVWEEKKKKGREDELCASINKRCGLTFSIRIRSRHFGTETALQKASKTTKNNLISVLHQKAEEEEAIQITSEKTHPPHTQKSFNMVL